MSNLDIIRGWKDEAYRRSLTDEQRAELPADGKAKKRRFQVVKLEERIAPSGARRPSLGRHCTR